MIDLTDIAPIKIQSEKTLLISGTDIYSEKKPLDPFHTFMCVYCSLDSNYYFTAMQTAFSPNNRGSRIHKYNPATNQIVHFSDILPANITNTEDTHHKCVIDYDSSGYIYVCRERGANTGHNTNLLVYKSDAPYDVTSFTLINEIAGKFSYPHLKITGTTIYLIARGVTGATADLGKITIFKSTDLGQNFDSGNVVYDTGVDEGSFVTYRGYNSLIQSYDGLLHLIVHERYESQDIFINVAHLQSADGITWSNASGGFSKNVNTSGHITRAELLANCLVHETPNDTLTAVHFEGGVVRSDGSIKILISQGDKTGQSFNGNAYVHIDTYYLYEWDGISWTQHDLSAVFTEFDSLWGIERFMYFIPDPTKDYIVFLDMAGNRDVNYLESSDNFSQYEKRVIYPGRPRLKLGSVANNVNSPSQHFVVISEYQTDQFDTNSYSDLILIKL